MKYAYVTLDLTGTLLRGMKQIVLVPTTCCPGGFPVPTPCESLPSSFDNKRVHVLERVPERILSMFNFVPVTRWKT